MAATDTAVGAAADGTGLLLNIEIGGVDTDGGMVVTVEGEPLRLATAICWAGVIGRGWLGSIGICGSVCLGRGIWVADGDDMAVDIGTGCVGRVMEVVLGEVEGMEIFDGGAFCSSKTCLLVRISLGGMG